MGIGPIVAIVLLWDDPDAFPPSVVFRVETTGLTATVHDRRKVGKDEEADGSGGHERGRAW